MNDSPRTGHHIVGGDCFKLGNFSLYPFKNRGVDGIGNYQFCSDLTKPPELIE